MTCCFPKVNPFPDVFFISLQELKACEEFPAYPAAKPKLVNLNKINIQESFLVFVSHAWLQDTLPDNEKLEKFLLTIDGVSKLKEEMAPTMANCYIWLDYSCLKGTEKTLSSFGSLFFNTILHCDCMFTPLVDHLADHWKLEYTALGYFHDYKASSWNGGKDSSDKKCYLNRAWCRTEAFYCSNLPLYNANQTSSDYKISNYQGCLKRLALQGYRPHFIYGHREQSLRQIPLNLPQLQNTYFADYHPTKGHVTDAGDEAIIAMLTKELELKYAQDFKMGYVGDYDNEGHQNGVGRYFSAKYDVYRGFFVKNKRQNHGVFFAPNGDCYDGNWENNQKSGDGVMRYISGNVYTGFWAADLFEGHGVMTYAHGPHVKYEGNWSEGKRHGHGTCTYRPGESILVIEGNWSKNQTKGKAHIEYSDGAIYDGETKDAAKHGKGVYISSVGKYKGDFNHDQYHGRGHMDFSTGAVFNGEWNGGVIEGRGSLHRDGEEYDGHFKAGMKCGHGRIVYTDKTVYVGEWLDDMRHGAGKLISADEREVKTAKWVKDQIIEEV